MVLVALTIYFRALWATYPTYHFCVCYAMESPFFWNLLDIISSLWAYLKQSPVYEEEKKLIFLEALTIYFCALWATYPTYYFCVFVIVRSLSCTPFPHCELTLNWSETSLLQEQDESKKESWYQPDWLPRFDISPYLLGKWEDAIFTSTGIFNKSDHK